MSREASARIAGRAGSGRGIAMRDPEGNEFDIN
jgi:hypothetical protein